MLEKRLPRISLHVREAETEQPVPIVSILWSWDRGRPHAFLPESRYWHAADGSYDVVVPEGATGAAIQAEGFDTVVVGEDDLADGREITVRLLRAE